MSDFQVTTGELTKEQKEQRMSPPISIKLPESYIWEIQVGYLFSERDQLEKEFNCEITFSGGKMNAQNNWEVTVFCNAYDVISLLDIKMINYQNELSNELQKPLGCLLVLKY